MSDLNILWCSLRQFSIIACYLREETNSSLGYNLLSDICRECESPPEPAFVQGKPPQLLQLLLTELVLLM